MATGTFSHGSGVQNCKDHAAPNPCGDSGRCWGGSWSSGLGSQTHRGRCGPALHRPHPASAAPEPPPRFPAEGPLRLVP